MSKTEQTKRPVQISGDAVKVLSQKIKQWTGWRDARLVFGTPPGGSPYALTDKDTHTVHVNADALMLNPNRVLNMVTPFRLRQEAVMTGVMLHEAGHARHSNWLNEDGTPPLHTPADDFTPAEPATAQTVALARVMEEARVEGLMARDADQIGATGLAWTMRASAANLMPMTQVSNDPGQAVMDVIDSWAKRAGRQIAYARYVKGYHEPMWVNDFADFLEDTIIDYLSEQGLGRLDADYQAGVVHNLLRSMILCTHDDDATMIDAARAVLEILFPETDGDSDDAPMPGGAACGIGVGVGDPDAESESGDEGEGDEAGADGEGNTTPEDEGSGDEPGAGDSGDQESDDSDTGADAEAEAAAKEAADALAKALADIEKQAAKQAEQDMATQVGAAPSTGGQVSGGPQGMGAGEGGALLGSRWRNPTPDERDTQRNAERFLRGLLEPSEVTTSSLTDSPSATVDGAALAAWKAGGEIRAPHFFRRTRRETRDSPPVQLAILVDVSISMSVLAKPSALLSWAASCAALDLRNFAGRGSKVSSCLIHWGNTARVIQADGQLMPGILDWDCGEGTRALDAAHDLVAEQMPGFFDVSDRPSNRLLVQFTDWELGGDVARVKTQVRSALSAGVNMISVVPRSYSPQSSSLPGILKDPEPDWTGRTSILKYDPTQPEQVWDHAAEALV